MTKTASAECKDDKSMQQGLITENDLPGRETGLIFLKAWALHKRIFNQRHILRCIFLPLRSFQTKSKMKKTRKESFF